MITTEITRLNTYGALKYRKDQLGKNTVLRLNYFNNGLLFNVKNEYLKLNIHEKIAI
jgi:hypothetical protein